MLEVMCDISIKYCWFGHYCKFLQTKVTVSCRSLILKVFYKRCFSLEILLIIMKIKLSGMQFSQKSYASFQNLMSTQCEFKLKSQYDCRLKLHDLRFNCHIITVYPFSDTFFCFVLLYHSDKKMQLRAKKCDLWINLGSEFTMKLFF